MQHRDGIFLGERVHPTGANVDAIRAWPTLTQPVRS